MKEDISIQDILLLIYSKKWIVIFSALIGAILALAYNSSLEKTYTIKLNYYAVDEKEIFPLRKMSSLFEMQRENLGHLENKEIFSINENQILRDYIFILQEKLIDYEKTAVGKVISLVQYIYLIIRQIILNILNLILKPLTIRCRLKS